MKVLVYNNDTNRMETYYKNLNDPMPYSNDRYLTVNEFKGSTKSDVIWTDKRTVEAFNNLRKTYSLPIRVGYGFKRIGEGGHSNMSQHYAGMALDIGQNMGNSARDRIRKIAVDSRLYTYVEPKSLTPTWVHVDTRNKTPACPTGGYPLVKYGSKGVYVATLQDALNFLGYNAGNIDGIFGNNTKNAVIRFQKNNNLSQDGIVGCNTWKKLTSKVAENR